MTRAMVRASRLAIGAITCAAIGVASARPAAADGAPSLAAFAGGWTRVRVEEDEAQRISAIRAAIAGLSWITRQFAGPILESTTSPPRGYEFALDDTRLLMAPRGEPLRPLPLDGSADSSEGPRGTFTRRARLVDGAIETRWEQSEATGVNVFRLDDEGTLVIDHTIHVTGLEGVETIQYRARFRRAPDVASSGR